jgi:integrase
MACVRKRRGKWMIDYRDASGKRRWKTVDGTRKDADEELAKIVKAGRPTAADTKRKFEEYALGWLETYVKPNCKQSTYWEYDSVIRNHLIPAFGNVPMVKIDRAMVERLVAQKVAARLSRSHVRNIIVPLREMFNNAIDKGLNVPNPAVRMGKVNYRRGDSKKIDPLTREEVATLLSVVKEKMPDDYAVLLFAFRTGARAGEIVAVYPIDLDFNSRFVQIARNSSRGQITTPKNGKVRRVDMSMQLTNVLDHLLAKKKADALTRELTKPEQERRKPDEVITEVMEHPLFTRKDGKPLDPNDLRRQIFYKALTAAGIRRVRFHDARHTFASLLLQQGESLPYVRDQLGHSSIQMTVDVYGHLVPGINRQAVDKLDDPGYSGSETVSTGRKDDPKYV